MSVTLQSYEQYRTPRAYEWMMRVGDPRTPPILFVPPLFEELNRTRAMIASLMRLLALEGHGCWLPDLNGAGESLLPLEATSWTDWSDSIAAASAHVEAASGRKPVMASIRGGCLLDGAADGACWWRFAPVTGRALARDLDRAGIAGGAEWAGYPASAELRESLALSEAPEVSRLRTVRLETDAAPADMKVPGPALWRRSEPGNAPAVAAALASDLNEWSRTCAAS
ncbi:MAG TPA: hypothetical protein VGB54_12360 [Allosphingosinicella sp.]